MANFIFNWATAALAAATLDLSTGNYYAHLVTTVPALGHATVADLVLPTTSGYASTALTGLSYNSTRWTFGSFSFPKYSFVSAPTGVVICKRNGATPATTDGIVCYSDFNNSIGQEISLQVGAYAVNLQFGSSGAINFSYRYLYSSGAFANTENIPKGLIFLIGSKNNTQAFADPNPTKIAQLPATASLTDRNNSAGGAPGGFNAGLDLGTLKIRPGTIGLYNFYPTTGNITVNIWASNNLNNNFATNYNNTSLYTLIGNFSLATGWNYVMRPFTVNNANFWQYFFFQGISSSSSLLISEVEFYDSSVLAPTANIV